MPHFIIIMRDYHERPCQKLAASILIETFVLFTNSIVRNRIIKLVIT